VPELWTPGAEGPYDVFVDRLHRRIAAAAERPYVEVELADGSRFAVETLEAEPGFGFVTLRPHPSDEAPQQLIVPLGSIRRIEVSPAAAEQAQFGFALPR
jgi:hypothetical protein